MRKLFSLGSTFLGSEKLILNSASNEQSRMEGKCFDSAFSWEVRVLLSFRSCKLQISVNKFPLLRGPLVIITNLLLTEREGRTGEYWPEVVTVRTERSEVRTVTTSGQYSPVRLEQARLVRSLLYGTLWCLFQFLHQKFSDLQDNKTRLENVRLLHPSLKFRKMFNLFSFFW